MTHASLLARLLLIAAAPFGCASPPPPVTTTAPTASSPPVAPTTPSTTGTSPPLTTTPPAGPPSPGDTPKGGPSTGGSSTEIGCYPRARGETCAVPESADASARLKLAVDGTVKHLKTAPGTDSTCCYSITSVSKGRVLVVSQAIRLAPLIRKAFA